VLNRLLAADGAFDTGRLRLDPDFGDVGSPVIFTGDGGIEKPLWVFAHLDTISYLVQPNQGGRVPLVPYCVHLMHDGECPANAYRYDFESNRYRVVAEGRIESSAGSPFFRAMTQGVEFRPGDRIAPFSSFNDLGQDGLFTGLMDNAGGVAALAVAAPVLAEAGVEAMLAFPDEEEGPVGAGNQTMCRGSSRIANLLSPPKLAIIADVQQGGGGPDADTRGGVENSTRLGGGAVLSEFSSLARGAVTPLGLYGLARRMADVIAEFGVRVQESNNAYSSRSDDVSVMMRTPNVLLLGYPGFNRHFDRGLPRAHLDDVVNLAKAVVYASVLGSVFEHRRTAMLRDS
jgi:putative aminopeptidase FrvX